MTARAGLFMTFEGGEGSGKTTQISRLAAALRAEGRAVVTTREPGGTPEAEKIRALLVQRDGGDWTPMAEALLLFAARAMHVRSLILPALERGDIVISDRFTDSTRAYQCYGHGLPADKIESLSALALDGFAPDLTFILDLPAEQGLARAGRRQAGAAVADARATEDRFERLGQPFHEKLRQGYLDIARKNPARCRVIDAAADMDQVHAAILAAARERLAHVPV